MPAPTSGERASLTEGAIAVLDAYFVKEKVSTLPGVRPGRGAVRPLREIKRGGHLGSSARLPAMDGCDG